jgi:23S rRNA pseudouridine955/2504/2580 synthase
MFEWQAGPNEGGQRLDRLLRKKFPEESLSKFFSIIRKKKVRVNGKRADGKQRIEAGDMISIYAEMRYNSPTENPSAGGGSKKLIKAIDSTIPARQSLKGMNVIWEDGDILLLHKDSGVASQPGSGIAAGSSLVEKLWYYLDKEKSEEQRQKEKTEAFRPALAHRLDKETSGLVLAAQTADALRKLNELIRWRRIDKEYLALVKGNVFKEDGEIKLALERQDSRQGAKMVVGQLGKQAHTRYKVEEHLGDLTLVRIFLETGRMHQIRAHFAQIGHPLLGDTRYGDFSENRRVRKEYGLRRLFLHAETLRWRWKGEKRGFTAAIPAELQKVIEKLRSEKV